MMKVIWRGNVLAESVDTIKIEGNYYFPPQSVNFDLLKKNKRHSLCYWKGLASYYDVVIDEKSEKSIAWYYANPTWLSKKIMDKDFSNYVAFWGNTKLIQ